MTYTPYRVINVPTKKERQVQVMKNDSLRFSFKVTGLERKQVAAVIADTIGEQVIYAGVPSFNYNAGGWAIDKQGIITTPEMGIKDDHVTLRSVLDALNIAGAKAERNLTVTLPMAEHTGNTLRNLVNLIWSKQSLIKIGIYRPGIQSRAKYSPKQPGRELELPND